MQPLEAWTPVQLLYNNFAVILGLVYVHLPFMVLPLYSALDRLEQDARYRGPEVEGKRGVGHDGSAPNGSSIAFVFEVSNRTRSWGFASEAA